MKTIVTLSLFAAFLCFGANAQLPEIKKLDYKAIEKNTTNPSSSFYYPNLLARYTANDTTLGLEDYRHLYYGSIFQTGYKPYGKSDWNDTLNKLLRNNDQSMEGRREMLRVCAEGLKERPLDLDFVGYTFIAHKGLGNALETKIWESKLFGLMEAILSTGSGRSPKDAIYVVSVSDEYTVLNALGYDFGGKQSLIYKKKVPYDYLTVEKKDKSSPEGLYFEISPLINHMKRLMKG